MLIDPFTVLMQVINFIILIFLLKRFLYKPVLKVMEEREKKIAAQIKEAEKAKNEAVNRAEALGEEKKAFNSAKKKLHSDAVAEVEKWKGTAMEQVRRDISATKKAWTDSLEGEKEKFIQQLKNRIAEQILNISQKVLLDLANGDIETRLFETFIKKIKNRDYKIDKNSLKTEGTVIISSGFPMEDDMKKKLRKTLGGLFLKAKDFECTVQKDLGFGICLHAEDWKIEWNLSWYMKGLEAKILQSFTPQPGGRHESA